MLVLLQATITIVGIAAGYLGATVWHSHLLLNVRRFVLGDKAKVDIGDSVDVLCLILQEL